MESVCSTLLPLTQLPNRHALCRFLAIEQRFTVSDHPLVVSNFGSIQRFPIPDQPHCLKGRSFHQPGRSSATSGLVHIAVPSARRESIFSLHSPRDNTPAPCSPQAQAFPASRNSPPSGPNPRLSMSRG